MNLNNYIPKNDINVDDRNFPSIKKRNNIFYKNIFPYILYIRINKQIIIFLINFIFNFWINNY